MPRKALITVGTTAFPLLISEISQNFTEIIDILNDHQFTHLTIQYGQSPVPDNLLELQGNQGNLVIRWQQYIENLSETIREASLVVTHGGAGTLLECIQSHFSTSHRGPNSDEDRSPWSQLKVVIVPNEQLMDNHQLELSQELSLRYTDWTRLIRLAPANEMHFAVSNGSFTQQLKHCLFEFSLNVSQDPLDHEQASKISDKGSPTKPSELRRLITALFE